MKDLYSKKDLKNNSDAFKSMEEIANENGFRIEKHQVITEEGYILGIWRIPGAFSENLTD